VHNFRYLLLLVSVCSLSISQAQSLRINEVSQGASGSKEYVELVVTGPTLINCSSQPACLDLRGWILDDNNGYFSNGDLTGTGLAAGAIRFSNDAFWQCINPGTIILIYNDNDINPGVPANDVSNTDANCKLVIPVSSALFERHESAPSTTSMAYSNTGWVSGGNWGPISMANGDDSFQIYAPSNTNTPVHGISWGNNNSNNFIFFAGAAGGLVFSCDNNTSADFAIQANWISAPVASGQTAGIANSTNNSALLAGMNLNCGLASPITVTVTPVDATCQSACSGSATLTVSGGQAPYATPVWSNGTTASSLSNLCAGNYSVNVTDANGCVGTQNFTINSGATFTVSTSGNVSICAGETTTISASGATTYNWDNGLGAGSSFQVSPTTSTTYNVTGTSNGCDATASLIVTVIPLPIVIAGNDQSICTGDAVTLSGSGALTYTWDNGVQNGIAFVPAVGQTIYTVTGTTGGCSATDQVTVNVSQNLLVDAGPDLQICSGEGIILSATGANQYQWDNGITDGVAFVPADGINTYIVLGTSGSCFASDEVVITVSDCGFEFEMPNVFTPDGNLVNDLYVPVKANNVAVQKFTVFNRWGNIVYESTNQPIIWDGKSSGLEVSEGVYFYMVKFVSLDLVQHELQGFIHLIRK
jgi:gliding motility-associated-like protein